MTADDVLAKLKSLATLERSVGAARFFKTGPGQYGEGDIFLGITVPEQRKVAREFFGLPLDEIVVLLQSPFHECRATALFIMVLRYKKGDGAEQKAIYNLYMKNIKQVNNWDLVDASAEYIVGPYLGDNYAPILTPLAHSDNLWERRISVIACFHGIMHGNPGPALEMIEILKYDSEDLIQKAVGWMLREIGKRCDRDILTAWLLRDDEYQRLPRTTLRYAIEHYSPEDRKRFLAGTF